MSNAKATWKYSLDCECPLCGNQIDLCDNDGYDVLINEDAELCEQDTERTKNVEIECSHCKHDFLVDFQY